MRTDTGQWDIRTSPALVAMFPFPKYRIYSLEEAIVIIDELSKIYGIKPPKAITYFSSDLYGEYIAELQQIDIRHFAHCKSLFHEWYHHLDNVTNGKYDSNDRSHGADSLGWQFADRLWDRIREERKNPTRSLM